MIYAATGEEGIGNGYLPRDASGTGIYHVMLRGINRQDIFEDAEDYMRMLRCMQLMLEQYDDLGNHLPPLCTFYTYSRVDV